MTRGEAPDRVSSAARGDHDYRLTERLELVTATVALLYAEARGPNAIGQALDARVPASWPPPVFEPDDVARLRRQLETSSSEDRWTLHYVTLRTRAADGRRELLGVAGYVGPPSEEGQVEIGYAIAEEYQRRGYATETVAALVDGAFEHPAVRSIVATTYASLAPSIGVLRKTGFSQVSADRATGLLRFERRRELTA